MRILTTVLILLLSACTVNDAAWLPQPTEFLERPERLDSPADAPFDLLWSNDGVNNWFFDKIIIQPVRTDLLDSELWYLSLGTFVPTEKQYEYRAFELSDYVQQSVAEAFLEKSEAQADRQFAIVKELPFVRVQSYTLDALSPELVEPIPLLQPLTPGHRTLVIQIAITHLTFGDPLVYAGLFAVPVPGVANLSTAVKAPSLGVEARLIDQESGGVIAEIVDRRFPQVKVIDFNRLLIARALEEQADSFAEDLAEYFYRNVGEKVPRRSPVSLIPW